MSRQSHPSRLLSTRLKIWTGIALPTFSRRTSFPSSQPTRMRGASYQFTDACRCSVQPLVAKLYDLFRLRVCLYSSSILLVSFLPPSHPFPCFRMQVTESHHSQSNADMLLQDVYVASIVLFEVGNVICGAAQTSAIFIGGRTVAGLGAAGLFSGGLVMLTVASPPKWRAPLIGGGMGLMIVGGALGPLIGGALTQHLGWRWCKSDCNFSLHTHRFLHVANMADASFPKACGSSCLPEVYPPSPSSSSACPNSAKRRQPRKSCPSCPRQWTS